LIYFASLYRNTKPLSDIRVRQALGLAIDKQQIVQVLFHDLAVQSGNWAPSVGLGYEKLPLVAYDLQQAKQLMKDAGYEQGFDISLQGFDKAGWPITKMEDSIASSWAQLNVRATVTHRDFGSYRTDWAKHTLPDPAATIHPIPGQSIELALYQSLV